MSRSIVRKMDGALSRAQLAFFRARPGIRSFLFHAVADSGETEAIDGVVDPTQTLTISELEGFIRHFKDAGHEFVSPAMIREGLSPDGRYVLMTFDDGYFNNLRVLPLLEAQGVPAVFFIATGCVDRGESFWWDVVHRERSRRGAARGEILIEQARLKRLRHDEVRAHLVREFGERSLRPVGHDDRPLTPDELRLLAGHPHVHIGNHTADHAILTNYSLADVERQLNSAQEWLGGVTGERPSMVSYPNGNYSEGVLDAARSCGFELGITVDARSSPSVPDDAERLRLGRFCFTRGSADEATFLTFRAPLSLRRLAASRRARGVPDVNRGM